VIDDYNIGDHAASGKSAIRSPRCLLHSQLIDPRSTFVRTAGAGSAFRPQPRWCSQQGPLRAEGHWRI